jgi:hypothetical protein
MDASIEIGQVEVFTSDNRGFTAQEMADRAVNRLLRINSRSELRRVLVEYFQEAQDSERMTLRNKLVENGWTDAAYLLGD